MYLHLSAGTIWEHIRLPDPLVALVEVKQASAGAHLLSVMKPALPFGVIQKSGGSSGSNDRGDLVSQAKQNEIHNGSYSVFLYSARFVYRFRTLAFHVSKTGSIPVPSTIFKGECAAVAAYS